MATNGFNYHSKRWITVRNEVHRRAGFKCEICGEDVDAKGSYNIDHIEPITAESSNKLKYGYENLRCLCIPCHNQVRPEQNARKAKKKKDYLNSVFDMIK